LVVIGVGNVLLGDDGAGVRVVEALRRVSERDPGAVPPGTRLIDGGTLGLALVRHLDGARGLVIVDAADRGEPPGTVTLRRDTRIVHDGGVGELLAVAGMLGVLPGAPTVVELSMGQIVASVGLSPAVEAAIPVAVATVLRELAALDAPAGVPA
jgi:hydrogenase maturation protease